MKLSTRKLIIFWIGVAVTLATVVLCFVFPTEFERVIASGFAMLGLDGLLSLVLLRCPYCGKSVHIFGMRYCPYCGEDISEDV